MLYCFIERSPRNPVITGKSDQLLDVRVRVVPKLDGIRKIERPPHSHEDMVERNRERSRALRKNIPRCMPITTPKLPDCYSCPKS